MSLSYTWEKFYVATRALAGTGTVQERLENAYISAIIRLLPDDVPDDYREKVRALQRRMTSAEDKTGIGRVAATTQAMSDEDALEIAGQIVDLFNSVAQALGREDGLLDGLRARR